MNNQDFWLGVIVCYFAYNIFLTACTFKYFFSRDSKTIKANDIKIVLNKMDADIRGINTSHEEFAKHLNDLIDKS